ncbi:hypothetical protein COL154_005113 [Colletotrichum chrysophilum]|nr:hypothetical protein COL154_005113 [Colletotrichum chrysophilum]
MDRVIRFELAIPDPVITTDKDFVLSSRKSFRRIRLGVSLISLVIDELLPVYEIAKQTEEYAVTGTIRAGGDRETRKRDQYNSDPAQPDTRIQKIIRTPKLLANASATSTR